MAAAKQNVQKEIKITPDDEKRTQDAIFSAKELISTGETKAAAAMVIYRAIENFPQETVVAALIEGANLTPKGARPYWYNCRRKLKAERK